MSDDIDRELQAMASGDSGEIDYGVEHAERVAGFLVAFHARLTSGRVPAELAKDLTVEFALSLFNAHGDDD